MSTPPQLTASDAAEIERFKSYLRAIAAWDNANDDLPDFAPIRELDRVMYEKKRLKAHFEIYERLYEGKATQWAFASHPESEHWSGPYETKHEAIVEALAHFGDPEDGFKPCVSRCRPVRPSDEDVEEDWTFLVVGEREVIDQT